MQTVQKKSEKKHRQSHDFAAGWIRTRGPSVEVNEAGDQAFHWVGTIPSSVSLGIVDSHCPPNRRLWRARLWTRRRQAVQTHSSNQQKALMRGPVPPSSRLVVRGERNDLFPATLSLVGRTSQEAKGAAVVKSMLFPSKVLRSIASQQSPRDDAVCPRGVLRSVLHLSKVLGSMLS